MIKRCIYFWILDLKKESFFSTVDWENLPNAPAPFIPVPDNDSDTFYFEGNENSPSSSSSSHSSFIVLARNRAIGFDEESLDHFSM